MLPELSMHMREEAAGEAERDSMIVSSGSKIEERIVQWLCQPVLRHIPRRVHPNTISLVTHAICWITAILAVSSVHLSQPYKSLALVGAGIGMLTSMIGDCLDGMHARNTDQCSKLGELMDHWLDAIIVPLVVLGASLALEMDPWAIALANVTATMVYHGQLVLYHHTGKFIHPEPASGMEAQFALSMGYVGLAALLYFVERHQPWLDVAISGIALLALFIQARCNWFYYVRLGKLTRYHLTFVAMCSAFGLLYWLRAIDVYGFALALTFVSFRICGTYVLFTIVKRRYDGNDWGVFAWLAAMFAGHFLLAPIQLGPITVQALLPYGASMYMLVRNLSDFSQYYGVLKPSPR